VGDIGCFLSCGRSVVVEVIDRGDIGLTGLDAKPNDRIVREGGKEVSDVFNRLAALWGPSGRRDHFRYFTSSQVYEHYEAWFISEVENEAASRFVPQMDRKAIPIVNVQSNVFPSLLIDRRRTKAFVGFATDRLQKDTPQFIVVKAGASEMWVDEALAIVFL
jgi:hypothetical protein